MTSQGREQNKLLLQEEVNNLDRPATAGIEPMPYWATDESSSTELMRSLDHLDRLGTLLMKVEKSLKWG